MQSDKPFVNQELDPLWNDLAGKAEKELHAIFDGRLKELSRLLTAYKNRFEKLVNSAQEDQGNIKHFQVYNLSLLELLSKYQKDLLDVDYENVFIGYLNLLDEETKSLPQVIRRKELFAKYQLKKGDKLITLIRKTRINHTLAFSRQGKKIKNIFRKLRKRSPESLDTFRKRRLPYRRMVGAFAGTQLISDLTVHFYDLLKGKSIVLHKLWKFDEGFDTKLQAALLVNVDTKISELIKPEEMSSFIDTLKDEVLELRKEIKERISGSISDSFEKLDQAMLITDTPDLPAVKFHAAGLLEDKKSVFLTLRLGHKNWNNTQLTLFDDWAVDVEIVLLYYSVLVHATELKLKINDFIGNQLSVNFDQLIGFINASSTRISEENSSSKKIEAVLKDERLTINTQLIDQLLSNIIERLSGSFTKDLDIFRDLTIDLATKISDRRGFIKSTNYDRGVKDGEINYISPRDLVSFEALPHFEKAIQVVDKLLSSSLERVKLKLLSVGNVCDFSLESASVLLQQKKNAVKGAEKVALEGYERALLNVEEAHALVETIRLEPLDKLELAIHEFNAEIQKLKNTENIIELNIRIVRIRAIEKSKKMRRDAVQWVRNIIPEIYSFFFTSLNQTNELLDSLKSRIGIVAEQKHISFEVSEFIQQTELAFKKLPFVYQRLYQLQPTDEDRFFVGRQKEFEQLEQAFNDWSRERFVITAVLSEKGGGITSFLGYFKRKIVSDLPVIHESPEQKIYEPGQYYRFFERIFEVEKFESNDEIIQYINGLPEKKVIILENLHHFFLKMVNGLECQKLLFDMMASTVKKVFWVGTYTIQSWDYLDKTISISDHFINRIELENMSTENLKEIIYKRNDLSGYKVNFEPTQDALESRSFVKMNEEEQQSFLQGKYFADLRNLSNGNVSLAQLYWLRSTRDVTDDAICVGSGLEIDLSFVKGIKSEYLFVLYTLLIHDGLTLDDYARIFSSSESTCRNTLIPMLEKGLLIKPKEKFNINPILFRQVVAYLRSRNFIS